MNSVTLGKFSHFISSDLVQELTQKAKEARENAYCPYSHYAVGAAILMESGKIFTGCNIESATYSPSCCAERVAIFKAVSEGETKIRAVAIVLGPDGSPCGPCSQVINEFNPHAYIFAATPDGKIYNEWRLDELLPYAFGPANLLA